MDLKAQGWVSGAQAGPFRVHLNLADIDFLIP